MTNLEFYKEDIKRKLSDFAFSRAICEVLNVDYAIDEYKLLDWLCEEHQILDKEEKEYLSAVIRPFIKRIEYISKCQRSFAPSGKAFITIRLKNEESIALPYFKERAMYKGMSLNKKYTVKELGL